MTAHFENAPGTVLITILVWFYVSALNFLEESKPSCVSRHWDVFKKKKLQECMDVSSLHRVLLSLSFLGCDFCSPTTVSVPVTELLTETSGLNGCFEKKRHYLLKERCRNWGRLSPPLSVSHWPSDQAQQEVTCRAKVMRSCDRPCSISAPPPSQVRWWQMRMYPKHAVCNAPNIKIVHFIYIYTVHDLLCALMEWHEGFTLLNTGSCTSFCIGKKNTWSNSQHWLLFEHSI